MIKASEEPLEEGQVRKKVKKKPIKGERVKPMEKVDILKGIKYELIKIEPHQRVTDNQTHLLVFSKSDKTYKYCLYDEPNELEILKYWEKSGK